MSEESGCPQYFKQVDYKNSFETEGRDKNPIILTTSNNTFNILLMILKNILYLSYYNYSSS